MGHGSGWRRSIMPSPLSSKPYWRSDCGWYEIWHGDCRRIMPFIRGIGAVVTDPPYGIGYLSHHQNSIDYGGGIKGDNEEYDPNPILSLNVFTILWGGNNFANRLPIGGWIVWDKRLSESADKILGSPFELAWCSHRTTYKIVRVLHGGCVNADAPNGAVVNQ